MSAAPYGSTGRMGDAEYDHLISLQLRGDPDDRRNLCVQPPGPGHRTGGGVYSKKNPVDTRLQAHRGLLRQG
ncbi:hypothetical protein [Streptomyces olivochromogenes]|uniref:hypothetical protein n=1 Tax=Streptomyces olivochromogenes TaxID=1963 RepID=UPI001F168912|nr:hypothetical protein [Streptomyces olivochromogenes]MCF3130185.1 hypothetical protein [Streptomyces olivochromogenes]